MRDERRQNIILSRRSSSSSGEIIVNVRGSTGSSVVAARSSTVDSVNGTHLVAKIAALFQLDLVIGYGFPARRLTQPVCHPTETLSKSAPDRMIAPVLAATLMACLLPTGKTSVAPTREFDS